MLQGPRLTQGASPPSSTLPFQWFIFQKYHSFYIIFTHEKTCVNIFPSPLLFSKTFFNKNFLLFRVFIRAPRDPLRRGAQGCSLFSLQGDPALVVGYEAINLRKSNLIKMKQLILTHKIQSIPNLIKPYKGYKIWYRTKSRNILKCGKIHAKCKLGKIAKRWLQKCLAPLSMTGKDTSNKNYDPRFLLHH